MGARNALEFSVDGVSQAANSLVELIDRFGREAFNDEEILEWIKFNNLKWEDYTWSDKNGGEYRPTKTAILMCLSWAGKRIDANNGQMNIQSICAYTLVNLRSKLQKLKHADTGSEDEQEEILAVIQTLEGAISIMVRAGWAQFGKADIDSIRDRVVVEGEQV